ncbi:putative transcription elongation factor SPT5 homolog 1 [Mercurialis annua]|uniref:putative transcription elongation factor SPT5 homolog 1 n=1 Tax=Mercurialis annua TaxID=3986 RepID=UPI0021602C85|nr:putative transcription elongation factor SPT5 homolog 1 [Mercurialis annua]
MARHRDDDDEEFDGEDEEYREKMDDLETEEELEEDTRGPKKKKKKKRRRSDFIDDSGEEDEDDEDEDYGGSGRGKKAKKRSGSEFFDLEAVVDSDDDEEEEEDADDDFIVDNGADLPNEDDGRRVHRRPLLPREDEQEDVEALERRIQARYARSSHTEYDEETSEVEQQALLPSVRDPKLWMVKCATGCARETAVCLMQKYIDKGAELQIRSAIALDDQNYIYIEAHKEAHVREACKGLRNLYAQKIMLVPIKEMADVLSVKSKALDISMDSWVRMKIGTYKGDLAKVVQKDDVRQRIKVKLIPRIDLQALANKLEGREVAKKKAFVPPPRFMNVDEARELHIRVERKKDSMSGDYFDYIGGMMFKDGFLHKTVSIKSISVQNIIPTFDELEKFQKPGENDGDIVGLSTIFANKKKCHFVKGDAVIIVKGDLKNLKGWVEKVDEENVHIRPEMKDLARTIAVDEKALCKYFEPGNHVKVVFGTQEGATGMVIKVEQHVLIILSDTTKEHIRVFANDVVESSEVTTGITKLGEYELHDLVQLDNNSFGVIIRVESEAFQVLKGVPERSEVALVKLREIKCKNEKKFNVQDRYRNTISVKDSVKINDGPYKGKQGTVEHIFKGILFIYDRLHLEHAGYICAKSHACAVVGGTRSSGDGNRDSYSGFGNLKPSPRVTPSPRRFPRGGPPFESGGRNWGGRGGRDGLVGTTVKIRLGPYKGYRGRVVDIKGQSVRVELESQMKVVLVDRSDVSDNVAVSTPHRDSSRYGMGSETPMHPSRTPLLPHMTPMRDAGATPIHDGMRTPMRDRAWNPYAPMSPPRDNWEDGNPGSWGTSPQFQSESPPSRAYEAPTPGGSYIDAGTPRDSSSAYATAPSPYLSSTPGGQPMTPSSVAYLPGTPGGQPMTPGTGSLDLMSPVIGEDNIGPQFMPDILVNVRKSSNDSAIGVIREVFGDGSFKIVLGANGNGETITAFSSEIEAVVPRKTDKIKIMGGGYRGATGKLIGIDGTDGIVKVDDTLDVKILDMVILAKLAQPCFL